MEEIAEELLSSPDFSDREEKGPFTLEEADREHIVKTLQRTRWVIEGQKGAAKILNTLQHSP